MALLHKATVVPGKLELLARWLPTRSWYTGSARPGSARSGSDGSGSDGCGSDGSGPGRVAAARLDDPAGAVGIEIMMIRAGDGRLLHVPLTYRGAPLAGAEAWLIGTTEHTVLGTRWVYDAVGDPVYAAQLAEIIRNAGRQAVEDVDNGGELVRREPDLTLRGSGADAPALGVITVVADGAEASIGTATHELTVLRFPGPVTPPAAGPSVAVLTGTWDGDGSPAVLATLVAR